MRGNFTRRLFMGAIPAVVCLRDSLRAQSPGGSTTRLTARTGTSSSSTPPGLHRLMLREDRDALLYIPESASKHEAAPLVVSLHGATRNADRGIDLLRSLSDEHGFVLLAPASTGHTWDVIEDGAWGPDVAFINQSLAR